MARRSWSRRIFAACLVLLAWTGEALAEDAESLLRRGIEQRRRGEDTEALASFQAAHELDPTPRAKAQIGLAEQALGRWLDADKHLGEALSAGVDPWIVKNREALEGARATVEKHLGWLSVTADAEGAELWIDGARRGSLPLSSPVRLVAGTAVVEVRAPGHEPVQRRVEVTAGATSRETFTLTRARPAPPPEAPKTPAAPAARPSLVLPLSFLGAGTALVAGGVASHVVATHNADVYNDDQRCFIAPLTRDERCGAQRTAAEVGRGIAIGAYVLGGLSLGAGVYFLVVRRAARPPRVACSPSLGGLVCSGRF